MPVDEMIIFGQISGNGKMPNMVQEALQMLSGISLQRSMTWSTPQHMKNSLFLNIQISDFSLEFQIAFKIAHKSYLLRKMSFGTIGVCQVTYAGDFGTFIWSFVTCKPNINHV